MRVGVNLLNFGVLALAVPAPALAQRTSNNATTSAEDAFGTTVGDQTIGIYNPYDVRGFSPVDAGNVRIEGLYFDQQAGLSGRLSDGSTIRVGLSAQSYPFPAPTGIADFTLRRASAKPLASIGLDHGPWKTREAEVDLQLPIDGERLGLIAGGGLYREGSPYGSSSFQTAATVGLRWSPRPGVEILPFWSYNHDSDDEQQPIIFTSGTFLPKRVPRNLFRGQPWVDYHGRFINTGVLARADPFGFDVRFGVFRSINIGNAAADLLFGSNLDGSVTDRLVILDNEDKFASTSGELRVSRSFDEGKRRHTFIASLRGRSLDRRYGGEAAIDLGASRYDFPDFRPEPAFTEGAKTRDRVRQVTAGLGYQLKWRGLGEFSLGIQKTRYTKTVTDPDPAIVFPETRDSPWLPSATAALYLTPKLALYGGFTRGLEESPVAPSEAVNLNEAPPAIRTEQKDAGLRWNVSPGLTAVIGVFDVAKPYFNLDTTGRFRRLGMVRNRGVEFSVAGQVAPGLSLVVGNVLLDAKLSGEEVDRGTIGRKPVGTFVRHTVVSVNYRLPNQSPWSFDAGTESTSDRVANRANTLVIPARSVFSLGTRYRFKLDGADVLLRGQVQNVFNTFGWNNGGSGYFVPNGSRRYVLSLAADV